MKRIIIALVLLAVTVMLNFLSEKAVDKYCSSVKKDLYKAIEMIENDEIESAENLVKRIKKDRSLVPYIYNLDFKKIKKELDDAENLLNLKEYEYAKICLLRSITLSDDIYEEYAFFHAK